MGERATPRTINIRPAVSVYATYRRLSYRPWYAIAEFVDNSTQNYHHHRASLREAYRREDPPSKLRVSISYDSEHNSLAILDNANGMNFDELTRAVVLDRPPPDPSGRSEYGMGLKTAACWFGSTWAIETAQLGSGSLLRTTVHVPDLVKGSTEEVAVEEAETTRDHHFTKITIRGLYKPIRGSTLARVRDQLGSMYREDIRSGEVEILWNGQPVSFQEPRLLEEDLGGGQSTVWRKDVAFDVPWDVEDRVLTVRGWVGIRVPGSQRDAGFVLLRRGRVITGGPSEGYKPGIVFGQGNTFRSQRLVGELHMDDWPVTQAKDTFDWSGGLEDAFVEELKRVSHDYMDKAEGYREKKKPITRAEMNLASEHLREVFADDRFGAALNQEVKFPDPPKPPEAVHEDIRKLQEASEGPVRYQLDVGTEIWTFRLHWQDKLSDAHWMEVSYPQEDQIDIFLNVAHPFFVPYLAEKGFLEILQRFVIALALAERMARQTARTGLISPSDIRMHMNKVLRRASEIEERHG